MEGVEQILSETMETAARGILASIGMETPEGWTASNVVIEAAYRAGIMTTFMGVPGWVDMNNLNEKVDELHQHIREIVEETS